MWRLRRALPWLPLVQTLPLYVPHTPARGWVQRLSQLAAAWWRIRGPDSVHAKTGVTKSRMQQETKPKTRPNHGKFTPILWHMML